MFLYDLICITCLVSVPADCLVECIYLMHVFWVLFTDGYAFSQDENGVLSQSEVIRVYDTTKQRTSEWWDPARWARPLSAVTQLFKGWQRAEACQFNFGQPRAPRATMDTKNEAVWERGKKIKFCCAVVVCSTADISSVLAYFCPACGQYGFWSVKQRRTAKIIDSPLSFAIPSAMSVTAKNVVLMRVVIKVLRNICGNGLWLWLPNH